MKVPVYTYKVTKGKFKGRMVKSFSTATMLYGIDDCPVCACYDDDGHDYVIYKDHLRFISKEETEVDAGLYNMGRKTNV